MITNINIEQLHPHLNNPRQDLGDLTELTESIKAQGVLQNLTVVPGFDLLDSYTVIIGHRRLAAAKLAGLTELPCAVVYLDNKQQASMMLLENMQRTDLTPYEQAQGFQQCLDLGITVQELSKSTGFSKKTVKHRLKMLELDQEKVKTTQGNMDDYIALEEISDIKERNRLLQFIGTNNFNAEVVKAKKKQDAPCLETAAVKKIEGDDVDYSHETEDLARTLRINFMKEVFKRKITGPETAVAVGIINDMFIFGKTAIDTDLFQLITNPNSIHAEAQSLRAEKNKSNYIVIVAYAGLEKTGVYNLIYKYLNLFGYQLSDDEKELLNENTD